MRIISGERKGHSIFSFKSKDVRPLSDKNRETIFNLLTGLITPNSGYIKINNIDVTNYPVYLRTKKLSK